MESSDELFRDTFEDAFPDHPEDLPKALPPTEEATPEEQEHSAWRERTHAFWELHQEILGMDGVLGFKIDTKRAGPVTVTLDKTANPLKVQQSVRDLFATVGLLDELRFKEEDLPPEHPHIRLQQPESDVPAPKAA